MPLRRVPIASLALLAACHSSRPVTSVAPGWAEERNIDREQVLLSSWRPIAPQKCMVAAAPAVLPAVDSLLTVESVPVLIQQGGIAATRGSALLSLRFDSTGTPTRVRVIEGTISEDAVSVVEAVVASALRQQSPGAPWGVRLRMELDSVPSFRVGRSEKCLPAPQPSGHDANLTPHTIGYTATSVAVDKQQKAIRFGVTVDERGHVVEAKILGTEGDAMALTLQSLILQQRYLPGRDDGIPVPMTVERTERIAIVRSATVGPITP